MPWTGLAVRCQLRRPIPTIYNRNGIFPTMLFMSRNASKPRLDLSTSHSSTDECSGNVENTDQYLSERADIRTGAMNLSPATPTKRKRCRPRDRVKNKRLVDKSPVFEHLKTDRPPLRTLLLRETFAESVNLRQTRKENPGYRILLKESTGPMKIMARTNSPMRAWDAYRNAVKQGLQLPNALLDRVFGVLIRTYAPTRETFFRLHEIVQQLRKQDGKLKLWQWNALIYHSALALRKVQTKDYQAALDVYREMLSAEPGQGGGKCHPDISTYTTLLYIAIRTGVSENVNHAYSLLRASDIPQDRIARLALIPYYIHIEKLKPIRGIALEFGERKQDIGLDGINAYMWAFGKFGYLDVMEETYQALRRNIRHDNSHEVVGSHLALPNLSGANGAESSKLLDRETQTIRTHATKEDVDTTLSVLDWPTKLLPAQSKSSTPVAHLSDAKSQTPSHQIANRSLTIWDHHIPNHITYAICIQINAYHGNYRRALQIFRDMITTEDAESFGKGHSSPYKAIHKVYRALFLGFARVTRQFIPPGEDSDAIRFTIRDKGEVKMPLLDEEERTWIIGALEVALDGFLHMDLDQGRPNYRTVVWIMHAFSNVSNGNNDKLVKVWKSLEDRFGAFRAPYSFRQIAKAARKDDSSVNPSRIVYNTSE